jgi:hypothetical protein|tara:strand:- start:4950 stop:5087 length:138 start_codon:yes stop_codon:yes gene_type:complete
MGLILTVEITHGDYKVYKYDHFPPQKTVYFKGVCLIEINGHDDLK